MCAIQLNMALEDVQHDARSRRNLNPLKYAAAPSPIRNSHSQTKEVRRSQQLRLPNRRRRDYFKWGRKRRQLENAELYQEHPISRDVSSEEFVETKRSPYSVVNGYGSPSGRVRFRYGNPDLLVTGWLTKRGRSLGRRVERFVELRGSTLSNRRREGGEPTWTVNVRGCQVLTGPNKEIVIKVAKEGWMSLYAHSQSSYEMWLNALKSVSTHVTDFYELGNMIGKGAYSEVLLARDKNRNELCAVKVLERSDVEHERLIDRELIVLKKLAHPNIVQVIDVFDSSKETFVVMEYLAGGELLDMITQHDHLSERNARHVIKAVLEAVDYLHRNNVVHRDIKPENILCVNRSWPLRVKITDFGLSKILGNNSSNKAMRSQCGTAYYLAPEVIDREKYGKPVDLWACGVVLYVMLAGKFPFYGDTDEKFMRRLKSGVRFPEREWRSIAPAAKSLIRGLLDPNPATRLHAQQALQHPWITGSDSEGLVSSSRPALAADRRRKQAQTQFNAHTEPMSLQLSRFIPPSIRKENAARAAEFSDVGEVLRTDDPQVQLLGSKDFEKAVDDSEL